MDLKKWLPLYKPKAGARVRLFCFPFAGGGAQAYRTWQAPLPAHVDVCALSFPGRELHFSEPASNRIAPLVETLSRGLTPLLDLPFAFFAYSMGALVGFELARALRREGRSLPIHFFAAAAPAPHRRERARRIGDLPKAEFIDGLRSFNGTPEQVLNHETLMEMLLPTLRADFQLLDSYTYSPEPPLEIPSTMLRGLQDASVREDEARAWGEVLTPMSFEEFSGGHFFLQQEQPRLLSLIASKLP